MPWKGSKSNEKEAKKNKEEPREGMIWWKNYLKKYFFTYIEYTSK